MDVDRQSQYQELRLQRFYLSQLSYGIAYIVLTVTWATGSYVGSNALALSHYLLGFSSQLVLFWMLKSGFNLRFKDPSLTSPQIIIGLLLQTYLLAFVGPMRGAILIGYCLILMFGVFQLSRRAYVVHAALALVCHGVLLALNQYYRPHFQELPNALLEWFVLACFLLWLTFLGSYIGGLRQSLTQRNIALQEHEHTQRDLMNKLEHLAATDYLTNLPNRRYFLKEAQRRLQQLPQGQTLGLAMIDLDYFKRFNDNYGHAMGDEVLQAFAQVARSSLREEDIVARFGGEEFILLLNHCDLATLHHCVERIRLALQTLHFPSLPTDINCTMSAGLCLVSSEDELNASIGMADEALYLAKEAGRNCTVVHKAAYA